MRNLIPANELDVVNNQNVNAYFNLRKNSEDCLENNALSEILTADGCGNFSQYIKEAGLTNDPDIIVLSSLHTYYYNVYKMKNIETGISLKELSQIKEAKSFLQSILQLRARNSNFAGCFTVDR